MACERELYEIGDRIRRFRKAKGLNQSDFAEKLGLSESTLSRLENGAVAMNILNFIRISHVLGVSMEELIPREEKEERS